MEKLKKKTFFDKVFSSTDKFVNFCDHFDMWARRNKKEIFSTLVLLTAIIVALVDNPNILKNIWERNIIVLLLVGNFGISNIFAFLLEKKENKTKVVLILGLIQLIPFGSSLNEPVRIFLISISCGVLSGFLIKEVYYSCYLLAGEERISD